MWISAWQYIGDTPQTGDPVLEPSQPGPWYTYTESAILEIISLHINVKGWTWRVDFPDIQTFRLQLSRKTSKTLVRLVLPSISKTCITLASTHFAFYTLTSYCMIKKHFCTWFCLLLSPFFLALKTKLFRRGEGVTGFVCQDCWAEQTWSKVMLDESTCNAVPPPGREMMGRPVSPGLEMQEMLAFHYIYIYSPW